jgi:hypothetical protein
MATVTSAPPAPSVAVRRDTRTLRRTAAAVLLPLGPLTVAVLRLCLPSFTSDTSTATIRATSTALGRQDAVVWLSLILVLTLVPSVLAAARLTQRRAPRMSLVAIALLVPGFCALLFSAGDPMVRALASGVITPSDGAKVLSAFNAEPAIVVATVVFVVGHIVGIVLLGVAFLRTKVVPAAVAIAVIVSQPLHFFFAVIAPNRFGDGFAWGLTAIGFLVAGLRVLRTPNDEWDLPPVALTAR